MRYIGYSMGSILGGGFVPYAKYDRAVFLSGGSPFTFLLARSSMFNFFALVADFQFYNRVDFRIMLTSLQILMDAGESSGWANSKYLQTGKLSSLHQYCLGDSIVSTVSSNIMTRNLNSSLIVPTVLSPIYGVPPLPDTVRGRRNVMLQGSYPGDAKKIPDSSRLPPATEVHGCFVRKDVIMVQNSQFVNYGFADNPCGEDACVFEDSAAC